MICEECKNKMIITDKIKSKDGTKIIFYYCIYCETKIVDVV